MPIFQNEDLAKKIATDEPSIHSIIFSLIGYGYGLGRIDMEDREYNHIESYLYAEKEDYDNDVEVLRKMKFATL